jgi:outer membrane protein OmpA-like peptidoglycan-associated protein
LLKLKQALKPCVANSTHKEVHSMSINHKSFVISGAMLLALGACASAPKTNPRLLAGEAALDQARADHATAEAGRASLEKADLAFQSAREELRGRNDEAYTHAMRMGEGYISLAQTRGMQTEASRKIESLNTDRAEVVSEARTREVKTAEAATATAEAATASAQAETASAEAATANAVTRAVSSERVAAGAVARAETLSAELSTYEQKKTALGTTLIMRDLQFASASSSLSAGAQGRLAPLAQAMGKQPETRIQIAGHTDSQGAESNNRELSAQRAAAVGAYLISTGVDPSRITSVGLGESAPVATNATAAGRAINRRVEVTILD